MYVVFEQRERGLQGSSFVESAWDRFYRDLDALFASPEAGLPLIRQPSEGDENGGGEFDAGFETGLETASLEQPGAA